MAEKKALSKRTSYGYYDMSYCDNSKVSPEKNCPLVSIIIPAYNVATYLDESVQSAVSQTYTNLEVVIVDDGSTDDTGVLCDEWALRDSRISVIHQNNEGISSARNTGLAAVCGEYVFCLDSDDRASPHLIERCIEFMSNDVDVVHFESNLIDENGDVIHSSVKKREINEDPLKLVLSGIMPSYVTRMLIRSSLAKKVLYPIGRKAEDLAVVYRLFSEAKSVRIIPDRLYDYRIRSGSIINDSISNPTKAIQYCADEMQTFREMVDWAQTTSNRQYLPIIKNYMLDQLFGYYRTMVRLSNVEGLDRIKTQLKIALDNMSVSDLSRSNHWKAVLFRNNILTPYTKLEVSIKDSAKKILGR